MERCGFYMRDKMTRCMVKKKEKWRLHNPLGMFFLLQDCCMHCRLLGAVSSLYLNSSQRGDEREKQEKEAKTEEKNLPNENSSLP